MRVCVMVCVLDGHNARRKACACVLVSLLEGVNETEKEKESV